MEKNVPPNLEEKDCVILFDGVCKLCNAWSSFIIRHDTSRKFKLCSVQSEAGRIILSHFSFSTHTFDTMLYVEGNTCFQKSDAFLKVMSKLGMPWRLAKVMTLVPRPIRDWCYDRVALNRYRLFGKYEQCVLPGADHKERYVADHPASTKIEE